MCFGEVFDLEYVTYSDMCFGEVFDLEYVTYSDMCFGEVFDLESPLSHYCTLVFYFCHFYTSSFRVTGVGVLHFLYLFDSRS